jgi:RNA polymerase sigma-70 factor (ECF subfamily)
MAGHMLKQAKADFLWTKKLFFVHFFMQSNGLYIRVIDERIFKTTKEVTALTRDIDYIVDKFSDDIYRAALAVTGSVHEAEDIVSEVIIKYFTRQGELFFNDDEHLKAWLLRTAINLSKDLLRSAGRRLRAENEVSASSDFSSPDMQIDVQNAINRLDKKYRIVLYLYYYQGYKTEEIADILGTGKGTVTSRLKRARGKLRLSLSDYDEKEMSV